MSKATTTETVYGGPPADGPTPTVAPGDQVPDSLNLTGSKPDEPTDKPVKMTSPWGTKVTVSSEANAEDYKNLGYKSAK